MTFNSHIQRLAIGVINASGDEKVETLNINSYKEPLHRVKEIGFNLSFKCV